MNLEQLFKKIANVGNQKEFIFIVIIWLTIFILNRSIRTIVKRLSAFPHVTPNKRTMYELMAKIGRYLLYLIGILFTLEVLKISIAPLLAVGSAVGVAIGLGAQEIVKDIIAGFMILSEDQYVVGDYVSIEGCDGEVLDISLITTTLRSGAGGQIYSIPNGTISIVTNYSRSNTIAVVDVPLPYEIDVRESISFLEKTFENISINNMVSPVTIHGVQEFGDSALMVRVTAQCVGGTHSLVQRDLRRVALEKMTEVGIEVPYPTQTVHIQKD